MNLIISFLIFLTIVSQIYAQNNNSEELLENSLLWEISRNDLTGKSYLFGTNHIIGGSFVDTSSVIAECFSKSEIIVTEVLNDDIDTAMLLESIKMKDDEYYSFSDIKDENYLKDFFRDNPVLKPYADFYFLYKPIFFWILYFYYEYFKNSESDKSEFKSLDHYYMNKAEEMNKSLAGLETVNEQMSIFTDSIPVKKQLKILLKTIRTSKEMLITGTSFLNTCYLSQDLNCLSSFMIFGYDFPDENKLFLENRNIRWARKLPYFINYSSAFIAVGAGHLPGKNGLISLLRMQGYEVKPLKF